jgi:hypothetical protein
MKSQIRWLLREVDTWVKEGIVSGEQAQLLRARYVGTPRVLCSGEAPLLELVVRTCFSRRPYSAKTQFARNHRRFFGVLESAGDSVLVSVLVRLLRAEAELASPPVTDPQCPL